MFQFLIVFACFLVLIGGIYITFFRKKKETKIEPDESVSGFQPVILPYPKEEITEPIHLLNEEIITVNEETVLPQAKDPAHEKRTINLSEDPNWVEKLEALKDPEDGDKVLDKTKLSVNAKGHIRPYLKKKEAVVVAEKEESDPLLATLAVAGAIELGSQLLSSGDNEKKEIGDFKGGDGDFGGAGASGDWTSPKEIPNEEPVLINDAVESGAVTVEDDWQPVTESEPTYSSNESSSDSSSSYDSGSSSSDSSDSSSSSD